MSKARCSLLSVCIVGASLPGVASAQTDDDIAARLDAAPALLKTADTSLKECLPDVLRESQGIALIANAKAGSFLAGGRWGSGVLVAKAGDGAWSDLALVSFDAITAGAQIGGQSASLLLTFGAIDDIPRRGEPTKWRSKGVGAVMGVRDASVNGSRKKGITEYVVGDVAGVYVAARFEWDTLSVDEEHTDMLETQLADNDEVKLKTASLLMQVSEIAARSCSESTPVTADVR